MFAQLDKDGFVVNRASLNRIPAHWQPAVAMTLERCVLELRGQLHSLYIRGSVVNGGVIDGFSDLDMILLTNALPEDPKPQWLAALGEFIKKRFPFIDRLEILVAGSGEVSSTPYLRVILKSQALCIYGEDVSGELEKLRPGRDMLTHSHDFRRELVLSKTYFLQVFPARIRIKKCKTIMKRILRTGFELVMESAHAYTRDLESCLQIFSEFYPERRTEMTRAFELSIHPTADSNRVIPLLEGLGEWVANSAEELISHAKPTRSCKKR